MHPMHRKKLSTRELLDAYDAGSIVLMQVTREVSLPRSQAWTHNEVLPTDRKNVNNPYIVFHKEIACPLSCFSLPEGWKRFCGKSELDHNSA